MRRYFVPTSSAVTVHVFGDARCPASADVSQPIGKDKLRRFWEVD